MINTALIIDDDSISGYLTNKVLKKLNLSENIISFPTAEASLQFLKEFQQKSAGNCPELIIVDIFMPGVDGFGFLEEFNTLSLNNREEVKIGFLTSSTHEKDINRSNDLGVSFYLNKPLKVEEVKAILEEHFVF